MQEKYSGAIYIIGPGNKSTYKKGLKFLNTQFKKVIVIGDGQMDILDSNNKGPLYNIIGKDYLGLLNEGRVLVYIDAHGTADENEHYIKVNKDGEPFASKKLFELLAESIKNPMDIIFIPCNGKAALMDVGVLPEMSRIIVFSESDKLTNFSQIEVILDIFSSSKFTLEAFYYNYLVRVFSTNESPTISIVGKETIDPVILSEIYLNKSISEYSRQYVHNNLGKSICTGYISCSDKIDHLINKIEQFSSLSEFRVNASDNYFISLMELTQLNANYEFSRNSNHKKVSNYYNYQESESCYIEILQLKNQSDPLLLKYEIPLELNLSDKDWYQIDYDYDDYDVRELFGSYNDIGIYNTLKYLGFNENNNFSKPEYPEYGFVLAIIKDIHLSLSLAGDFESA